MMENELSVSDPLHDAIIDCVGSWPTAWHSYDENRHSQMMGSAIALLVTAGYAECRLDFILTAANESTWSRLFKSKESRLLYIVRGFDWLENARKLAKVDSRINGAVKRVEMLNFMDFRLTRYGEESRSRLSQGFRNVVLYDVLTRAPRFEFTRLDWSHFHNQKSMSAGRNVAAAQAIASVTIGETKLDQVINFNPVINPVIQMASPISESPDSGEFDEANWKTLAETARGLGLKQSSDVSKLIDKKELKDNGLPGRPRRVSASSILEYIGRKGMKWKEDDNDDSE